MGKKIIASLISIVCLTLVIGCINTTPGPTQEDWAQEDLTQEDLAQEDLAQDIVWEQINENGFGASNARASGMVVFDGSLYAGTLNQTDKAQVWRYDGDATWTRSIKMGSGEMIWQYKA